MLPNLLYFISPAQFECMIFFFPFSLAAWTFTIGIWDLFISGWCTHFLPFLPESQIHAQISTSPENLAQWDTCVLFSCPRAPKVYTGWPRKNATPTINNFKKMKKLCALMCTEFFSQQNDTKIINFDEGILIVWSFFWGNVIFKICHFCLKSHSWLTANSILWLPRVKCLLLLWKMKTAWIKRSIHYVNFAALKSRESYSKKFLLTSIVTFDRKEAKFANNIASEKWL